MIFQPLYKAITTFSGLPYTISEWEYKKLSNEKFTPPYTANKCLSQKVIWNNSRIRLKFERSCLKQEDKAPFTTNRLNLFIVYCSMGKNVIIFGVDMSSSVHTDNKKKDILILGKVPTQGLDDLR